ncbi:MAG: hypothetical protein P8P74_01265 [Crocinitomicaceae bacterium]|nr:hypothetical protein [Crocinitomicaceae bacterium]
MIKYSSLFFILVAYQTLSFAQTYASNGMVVSDNAEASKVGVIF